jgi:hypothetical protein
MKLDVVVHEYQLSERQQKALEYLLESEEGFSIQDFELLCPGINRRALQRDLADLIAKGLISQHGIKKAARYKANSISI